LEQLSEWGQSQVFSCPIWQLNEVEWVSKGQYEEAQQPQGSLSPSAVLGRRFVNDRLLQAERAFLDDKGLTGIGQSWYKHLVCMDIVHMSCNAIPHI
jgi:hypothetical protein